ncbi:endothelin-2 [Melanotaenia boesemani]|uniref:endothelin-2 n=1 Tax=Melanotaenia boesemani TaxID=1250792 RepID=UPI001C04CC6F|nr:endothelin-2 [Melanotaenia boesemani]
MPTHSSLLLLVTFWASVQEGLAFPVLKEPGVEARDVSTHHVRTKRCACSNQLDSECHYFCHLDIIWINTPSKTTTYGLGGALLRRRRSTGRCTCAIHEDQTCTTFCHLRPEIKPMKRPQFNIISILRAAVDRLNEAQDAHLSDKEETSWPERKNA